MIAVPTVRRNWLFNGGPRGSQASAFTYTLVESARANELEPVRHLALVFEQLTTMLSLNCVDRSLFIDVLNTTVMHYVDLIVTGCISTLKKIVRLR